MKDIIEKAVRGGYKKSMISVLIESGPKTLLPYYIDSLIFSHDFLKAWTKYIIDSEQEDKIGGAFVFTKEMRESKYHFDVVFKRFATQLVLAEDRISYLRGFLNENN